MERVSESFDSSMGSELTPTSNSFFAKSGLVRLRHHHPEIDRSVVRISERNKILSSFICNDSSSSATQETNPAKEQTRILHFVILPPCLEIMFSTL